MEYRIERDSLGDVEVPKERLYGAQTARSLRNFKVGSSLFPHEVIDQLILIKKAAANVNCRLGVLDEKKKELICEATDELLKGGFEKEFPLPLFQTGSGTQSNMNVNEVISNLVCKNTGKALGSKEPVHPNDHVNKSQSSNDVVPTAIHMAVTHECIKRLLPGLKTLSATLRDKEVEFKEVIKVGRTHLMDATPLSLGSEFGGYKEQIDQAIKSIEEALYHVQALAIGGTAVGTGINTPKGFQKGMIDELNHLTHGKFRPAQSLFEALSCEDNLVFFGGALNRVACALFKIANDIRLYASGPRAGIAELELPANEPGSSIMPGKVNPTQCESMTMIAAQVMGNYTTLTIAASQGHFQLNVYRPVIAHALLESIAILGDGAINFAKKCIQGIKINQKMMDQHLQLSLMLVTALVPHIGYDKAAKIALYAHEKQISLKKAAEELAYLAPEEYEKLMDLRRMAYPHDD
ncbi:MAG: class II fumarate hydratase [Verrucomicrobia bacterium]|nr:class II fumarate hydratase [Verrucomicrobiota bacterium]